MNIFIFDLQTAQKNPINHNRDFLEYVDSMKLINNDLKIKTPMDSIHINNIDILIIY